MDKAHIHKKLSKLEGHLSVIEKSYKEFKLHNDKDAKHLLGLEKPYKHSEEVLIENAVKTTIQRLTDKGWFYNYDNVVAVSEE